MLSNYIIVDRSKSTFHAKEDKNKNKNKNKKQKDKNNNNKKNLLRFFVSNKMLPVSSSAQEPISYFSCQECSVHVRIYAYAYSRNLENISLFPESIFIIKSG